MEDTAEFNLWEITFICTNNIAFICRATDVIQYQNSRTNNPIKVEEAWNKIQTFIRNIGYQPFNKILQMDKFKDINTLNNQSIIPKQEIQTLYTFHPNNNNDNNETINNHTTGFIEQIGVALRDKMKTKPSTHPNDAKNSKCTNSSKIELETIAFAKIGSTDAVNKMKETVNTTPSVAVLKPIENGNTKIAVTEMQLVSINKSQDSQLVKVKETQTVLSTVKQAKENQMYFGPIPNLEVKTVGINQETESKIPKQENLVNQEKPAIKKTRPDQNLENNNKGTSSKKNAAEARKKKREKKKRQKERKKEQNALKNKTETEENNIDDDDDEDDEEEESKIEIENERSDESMVNAIDLQAENLLKELQALTDLKKTLLNKDNGKAEESSPKKEVTKNNKKQQKDIKKPAKETIEELESDDESESSKSEESMLDDISFINDNDEMPAFVKSLYYKSKKKEELKDMKKKTKEVKHVIKKEKETVSIPPNIPNKEEISDKDAMIGLKTGKLCIGKACDATMKGQPQLAVKCFTKAIELEPNNLGHYLNRSYFNLRINSLKLAHDDAKYVIQKSENVLQIALAKCRIGQVYCALQNYSLAEQFYEESLNFNPNDKSVMRELLNLKVKQLVNMGFPKKSSIEVLYNTDVIMDACNKLSSQINNVIEEKSIPFTSDNDVYYSDDETVTNNVVSLTNLTNYHFEKRKQTLKNKSNDFVSVVNNSTKKKINTTQNTPNKEAIKKEVSTVKIPVINYKDFEDKVLWIGSLTPAITTAMIKKKFNTYGKVVSVIKPAEDTWAFVNFETPIRMKDVLADAPNCKINDIKIVVRPRPKKH